jgi:hypothetical protein
MSKIAVKEKMNGIEWKGTRLNGNNNVFENTIDYR